MKNFFKGTLYLIVFAAAGIMFQISCSNSDDTNMPNAENKILITKYDPIAGHTLWYCDTNGSNLTQIPLALPANNSFHWANANSFAKFSSDGEKVFFVANVFVGDISSNKIYSCNLDGTNLQEIMASTANESYLMIGDVN